VSDPFASWRCGIAVLTAAMKHLMQLAQKWLSF
jgi:hypothetical protein